MSDPLFSVIVCTYDRPYLLSEALRSIMRQTLDDFECIIVDDASPQPAEAPDDPRFRVVRRSTNGGEPAARNTGLESARGRYVTWLDDDDLYTPDRLSLAAEGLKRAPVAICFRQGENGSTGGNHILEGDVYDTIYDHLTPNMGQTAIERSIAPLYNESFPALTDVEWWLRVARKASVATVPRVGHIYRQHSGTRNRNGLAERVRCSLLLLDEHADYFHEHRRAAAFRWKRIGLMANLLGDYRTARRAFRRSLRILPEAPTVWHYGRSLKISQQS